MKCSVDGSLQMCINFADQKPKVSNTTIVRITVLEMKKNSKKQLTYPNCTWKKDYWMVSNKYYIFTWICKIVTTTGQTSRILVENVFKIYSCWNNQNCFLYNVLNRKNIYIFALLNRKLRIASSTQTSNFVLCCLNISFSHSIFSLHLIKKISIYISICAIILTIF